MLRRTRLTRTLALAMLTYASMAAGQQFEITRQTIDGGGAMNSTGGNFELSGTIGQPDAGIMAGGSFELTGGFWFGLDPGDCNESGTVELNDHYDFLECMSGPATPSVGQCACFDIDGDGYVDLMDFAETQTVFTSE